MELLDAHGEAMRGFDRVVHQVGTGQWHEPTPCTEWDVRDLVTHLVSEQLWAPHLLAGATLEEIGDRFDGDVLGADPVGAWERAAAAAREAWTAPGVLERTVHVSGGEAEASRYGWEMTVDLAVHGWDLATAIGVPHPIGDALAATLLERFRPLVDDIQGLGIFAPPVPVAADADAATELVALLGRNPG
ncbi:TIGR03086 family metal-binding protein [Amycolatopsis aidingensis]|uniref:TIGR03086 family metal-binding protein n=1 Tax=Amycolatopsis aidingensis TaxID=2842453 RepID=UPI001C0CDD5F|nr:TIGR03086 family metal-binding protein [Amycolatopsis aidingensis]